MSEFRQTQEIVQNDSIATVADTAVSIVVEDTTPAAVVVEDTLPQVRTDTPVQTTVIESAPMQRSSEPRIEAPQVKESRKQQLSFKPRQAEKDTTAAEEPGLVSTVDRYSFFEQNDSTHFAGKPSQFVEKSIISVTPGPKLGKPLSHHYHRSALNWTLMLGLICVLLLLALKAYYKKFMTQVVSTLVNFQLAEKMLREKNIIVRRAFLMMNINFVLALSLFILLLAIYWQFRITQSYFLDYLSIAGIVVGLVVVRFVIFYITGFLFEKIPAVNEHLHMIFLVNKNLGLILLPLAFLAIYSAPQLSRVVLYVGVILFVIATIYKLIRGFIIIKRSGVFLFYAILYLCTLELLPLLVGSKLIISLR